MLLEHHYNNSTFAKWAFAVPNDESRVAISRSIFLCTAKAFFTQTRTFITTRGNRHLRFVGLADAYRFCRLAV